MGWWQRVAVLLSPRRVRVGLRSAGLRKLRQEVRTCEYNDVHVMWEMLRKADPEIGSHSSPLLHRRRWASSLFHWAPCNLCRNF